MSRRPAGRPVRATLVARCWLISVGAGAVTAGLAATGALLVTADGAFLPQGTLGALGTGAFVMLVAAAFGALPALAIVGAFAAIYRSTGRVSPALGAAAGGLAVWLGVLVAWPGASRDAEDLPAGLVLFGLPGAAPGYA